ncbi:hypothetical protein HPB51_024923 [Rhipicephalus microplus]|uniref:Ig-like domain-containing protein n=1 Tax=Rhipicephalus microplus TaxID=6941 RepID=A0A9J6F8E1_RHIMP|nr:hypothetical protein HPB51_024923 [Rhipicephalus microplus]
MWFLFTRSLFLLLFIFSWFWTWSRAVAPYFVDSFGPRNLTARENSNVSFRCEASGNPEPKVSWRREDAQPFRVADQKVTPMIWVPNQVVGAPLGSNVVLECHTEAHPPSENFWFRSSHRLDSATTNITAANELRAKQKKSRRHEAHITRTGLKALPAASGEKLGPVYQASKQESQIREEQSEAPAEGRKERAQHLGKLRRRRVLSTRLDPCSAPYDSPFPVRQRCFQLDGFHPEAIALAGGASPEKHIDCAKASSLPSRRIPEARNTRGSRRKGRKQKRA